jgi:hypothetical protein
MKQVLILILAFFNSVILFSQNCSENVSLGNVTSSSSSFSGNVAGFATDGNINTRWESEYSDVQSITVDLGVRHNLCGLIIRWENAAGRDYVIQASDNNADWNTISTVTNNSSLLNNLSFSVTARYIRMLGSARTTAYGYSIYEFEVLGSPAVLCASTNIALNKPATASSENGGNPASHAFDNNPGTRWESNFSDPQLLTVDLGSVYNLCKIEISWEAAFGKDFQIQLSDDGISYNTVRTIPGNVGLINNLPISGNARYVRMFGTERGTGYGYSIYEFRVFGSLTSLPLQITKLNAANLSNSVHIDWQINDVKNILKFDIERYNNALNRFEKIGSINKKDNSIEDKTYSFLDQFPSSGLNVYRICQHDIDGKFYYSKTVTIRLNNYSADFSCSFNSGNSILNVKVPGDQLIQQIKISSMNGSVLKILKPGSVNTVNAVVKEIIAGMYVIEVITDQSRYSSKIIKR